MKTEKRPQIQLNNEELSPEKLTEYTFARVKLPKTGFAIKLKEVLALRADHAAAKDAIFTEFNIEAIQNKLTHIGEYWLEVSSEAITKELFLKRPDLGKELDESSQLFLTKYSDKKNDVVIIISNGLSASAVNSNAAVLLNRFISKLQKTSYQLAPIIFAKNGRVAIGDRIGEILQAKLSIILIGERPGLSSPDSMSVYFTYAPKIGLTDESRNCISNIRSQGFPPEQAADKLFQLITTSLSTKISGVHLKDDTDLIS